MQAEQFASATNITPDSDSQSTEPIEEHKNDVASNDSVTIISSQNFDSDGEEEFLTDDDFKDIHDLQWPFAPSLTTE